MTDPDALALFVCANCHEPFSACLSCVNALRIDPLTGLPPDAYWDEEGALQHFPVADPEAVERSVKMPVCDACVEERNTVYLEGLPEGAHIVGVWETAEQRHRRSHR